MLMTRRSPGPWLPWLLGAITFVLLALLLRSSPFIMVTDPRITIIMIGLVVFVVNIEVPLVGDSISVGYAAGLLAYLSMAQYESTYEAFGVIIFGGAIGGLIRAVSESRRLGKGLSAQFLTWPLVSASQLALSLLAGGAFYSA